MFKTGIGSLIIEVSMSNVNGNPDNEGAPRQDPDGYGVLTDVSVKRKVRDIIMSKELPLWQNIAKKLGIENEKGFDILENPELLRQEVISLIKSENGCELFHNRFVDARLFGNTFLEAGLDGKHVRSGIIVFNTGRSVAPIEEIRMTCTKRASVEEGKDRGMAPDRIKDVRHAIYYMTYSVDYFNAKKTWCTQKDVDLFMACVPYIFEANKSTTRKNVRILSAPYLEFDGMGTKILDVRDSFCPIRKDNPTIPSTCIDDYIFPGLDNDTVKKYRSKMTKLVDLCD